MKCNGDSVFYSPTILQETSKVNTETDYKTKLRSEPKKGHCNVIPLHAYYWHINEKSVNVVCTHWLQEMPEVSSAWTSLDAELQPSGSRSRSVAVQQSAAVGFGALCGVDHACTMRPWVSHKCSMQTKCRLEDVRTVNHQQRRQNICELFTSQKIKEQNN